MMHEVTIRLKDYVSKVTEMESAEQPDSVDLRMSNAAIGLASEVFEVSECLLSEKIDYEHMLSELGDTMWYFAVMVDAYNKRHPDNLFDFNHSAIIAEKHAPNYKRYNAHRTLIDEAVMEFSASSGHILSALKHENVYKQSFPKVMFKMAADKFLMNACRIIEAVRLETDHRIDVDLEVVCDRNIKKLELRHPDGFSVDTAINRDLGAEKRSIRFS